MKLKPIISKIGLYVALLFAICRPAKGEVTAFTYQGRLDNNGSPANGSYDLTFALYNVSSNGVAVAGPLTNTATAVSNGLFTVILDYGADVFNGAAYWLEIGVQTNGGGGFATLSPRQPLTATPYAVFAGSASNLLGTLPAGQLTGTIPSTDLSGTYTGPVTFDNGANSFDGTFTGQFFGSSFFGGNFNGNFFGDGSGLYNIEPGHIAGMVAYLNSNQTFTAQNVFLQNVGIGNPNPLCQLDVLGGQAAARFMTTNSVNGSVVELRNTVANPGEYLGAINFNNASNGYPGQIAYIAGDTTNELNDYLDFRVGGAVGLTIQADPRGSGAANLVGGFPGNSVSSIGSGSDVIAGGGYPGIPNRILSNTSGAFIGAGSANQIGPNLNDSVIAGGYGNQVQSPDAAIGGGVNNSILTNAQNAVICGGGGNSVAGYASSIAGGTFSTIQNAAVYDFIGGGYANDIQTNAGSCAIVGGDSNTIQPGSGSSFLGGGGGNVIQAAYASSIVGGVDNTNGGVWSFMGGGSDTAILPGNQVSVLGGGGYDTIGTNNFAASILGGQQNLIQANGEGSAIVGGQYNTIDVGSEDSFIGGGNGNFIQSSNVFSVLVGGWDNSILTSAWAATVGGGEANLAGAYYSTVPGGVANVANGIGSFAAGCFAQATNAGAFVLADNQYTNFYSTASNQLSARFTGGVRFVTAGAGMTLDGVPILSGSSTLNASQLTGPIPSADLSGNYTNAVRFTNAGNLFAGNGTGLTNVNAATLNGLPSGAFAPAAGSTNYIQNQMLTPQSASFNINGSAVIGGGVFAGGPVSANSLLVTNAIHVTGAGIGTGTAAFTQLTTATNISSDQTIIYNPLCDGDPNAILIITHNYNPQNSVNSAYNKVVGVYYNGAHWTLYNEDLSTMSANIAFNVLVIKP